MKPINSSIEKVLKDNRIFSRPHASPGVWISFLLPVAILVSCYKSSNVSVLYLSCAINSFNLLLNIIHLLFHILKYKSINVTQSINFVCVIPACITIFLYKCFLNLDFQKSLSYTVANALIYFEGVPFLLKAFPRTFTFGEVNVVIQGFSLLIYSLFLNLNTIIVEGLPQNEYDISSLILLLVISWLLLLCIVPFTYKNLKGIVLLYIWVLCILGFIYLSIKYIIKINIFFWIWSFLTKTSRIKVVGLWSICSVLAVVIVQQQIRKKQKSNTILRKYFHGLAVAVFLSGILFDISLIYFSSGCVFGLFIILEFFRILKLPPLFEFLQAGFSVYSDEKDTGIIAMTPIFLLVGISLPLWLYPEKVFSSNDCLPLLSGVISVGIGDTCASIGGKYLGKHNWKGSKKTIEGSFIGILSQIIFIQILGMYGFIQNIYANFFKILIAICCTSIVEAKTDQIDNIVLPLSMYILLII